MNDRRVDILDHARVFEGYFRIERYRLRHSMHEGGMSEELTREVFERGHAVGVLPYDPVRDEVVVIEQFRIGAYAAGDPAWLTEIVAGIIDEGETAEQVARREIQEEAGLVAAELLPMVRYLVSPGGTSETVELFLARVDAEHAGGIHGLDHEQEDIRVFTLPLHEAETLLDAGKINNAMTLVALQWLSRHHEDVLARWGGSARPASP